MQRKMKKPIALLLTLLMFVSTVVGSGLFVSVEAAEDDTTNQIGAYYEVNDKTGVLPATPSLEEGHTQQSYANGQVLVNKTISATANENEFKIDLEVITNDEIENRTISADAAVVLVIDTSNSMNDNRLNSVKRAAQEFINSFVDENANRQIAIVKFSGNTHVNGATTVQSWTSASNLVTENAATSQTEEISKLGREGGTNIEAGLILAKNLLNADAVAGIGNKNIILLTDGQPTYGVATSEQSTASTTVVCEDGDHMIGGGQTTTHTIHTNVETFMDNLDSGITPYAVYVGDADVECTSWNCDLDTTGEKWLRSAGFDAKAAGDDAEELANIFKGISETIKKQAKAWFLTDPMGAMVDFEKFDSDPADVDEFTYSTTDDQIVWNLRKANPEVGGTETAPTYTYNLSYTVKLDTLDDNFVAGTYYPTNGVTSLTYMITTDSNGAASYSDGVAYCNIPSVKGFAGDLTFNKVDKFDVDKFDALPGATFTLTTKDDATFSRTAVSDKDGVVAFAGIPSGHKYTLTETETPTGYVENATKYDVIVSYGSVSTPGITGGKVVNTSKTVDIAVTKSWEDADDQDGLRPDSISVQLLADGEEYGDPVDLNEANDWTYTWEDLPQYKAGEEIVYSVAEVDVPDGYVSDVDGFEITNTHTPATVDKTVEKIWVDANDQDGLRPDSVSVQLYANGTAHGNPVTLSDTNNWKYTWKDLAAKANGEEIKYTVKETNVPDGYTDTYSEDTFTITNTHVPAVTTYTVTKKWDDDDNRDGIRPESVSVQLYADGEACGDPVPVTAGSGWTYTWTNLPVNKDGKAIAYTVKELTAVKGYTSSVSDSTITNKHDVAVKGVTVKKVWDDADDQDGIRPDSISVQLLANGAAQGESVVLNEENGWEYTWEGLYVNENGKEIEYTVEETDVPDGYVSAVNDFVITNSYTPKTTEYTVTKVWADDNNRDGLRPDSVTVQLYADGVEKDGSVSVTAENDWTYTWTNLPVNANGEKIAYTVKEVDVADDYTSSVSGSTITNSHVPEVTERTVTKSWDDDSDRDGLRPDSISVQLLANGEAQGESVVLNEENDWTYTWGNLFVYEDGEEIEYTVEEVNVPDDYTATYSEDTFAITNSHTPKVTSITANKVWNDANNQDGIRPDSVAVQLYANGEAFGDPVVLNEENGWECAWDDLFVYENGEAVVYTVKEVEVADGYTSSVDGTTITNTHTPATVEKTVEKVWDDNNDAAKKRPDSISVQLYADGEALGEPVVLNNESGWKYTWADLAQYADGKEVVYTVKEVKVPDDYTATYSEDTFTITNTVKAVPDTGDTSDMWIWMTLLCVSGLGLFATALYSKTAKKIKK